MKLYVGNVHKDIEENELKKLFFKYTSLTSVELLKDSDSGKSKGFAFVEFENKNDGDSAMKEFDGHSVRGMDLKVNVAAIKNKRPSRPSGLF